MTFRVYEKRPVVRDELIGQAEVSLDPLDDAVARDVWFPLRHHDLRGPAGQLHVRLRFTPEEERHAININDFELLKVLGRGSYGKVMQVRKKDTGAIYAMKVMQKSEIIKNEELEHVLAEKKVLAHLRSPFIVELKYSFQTEEKIYLVMTYVQGGELFVHLQREGTFTEERARFYAAEVLLSLQHLHRQGVIYRDLKPENILLDVSGHLFLTDFGLCKDGLGFGEKTKTFCGTPEYLAPEVLQDQPYGTAVDWWSFGCLVYEMLVGLPPFYSRDSQDMYNKILYAPLKFPKHVSPHARDLLKGLLERDPELRLGSRFSDAEEIKNMAWFMALDWVKVEGKKIEPQFKPTVRDDTDTGHFDSTFTKEKAKDTIVRRHHDLSAIEGAESEHLFEGFTYVAPASELRQALEEERIRQEAKEKRG